MSLLAAKKHIYLPEARKVVVDKLHCLIVASIEYLRVSFVALLSLCGEKRGRL